MVAKIVLFVLLGTALAFASPTAKDDEHDSTAAVITAINDVEPKGSEDIIVPDSSVTDQPLETVTARKWYKKYLLDKIVSTAKKAQKFSKIVMNLKPEKIKKYWDKLTVEYQAIKDKFSKVIDQGTDAYQEIKKSLKLVQEIFNKIKNSSDIKESGESVEDTKDTPHDKESAKILNADAKDMESTA